MLKTLHVHYSQREGCKVQLLFGYCIVSDLSRYDETLRKPESLYLLGYCTSTRLQQGIHTGASCYLTHKRSRSDVLPDLIYEDCVRERHYVCGKLVAGVRVVFRE